MEMENDMEIPNNLDDPDTAVEAGDAGEPGVAGNPGENDTAEVVSAVLNAVVDAVVNAVENDDAGENNGAVENNDAVENNGARENNHAIENNHASENDAVEVSEEPVEVSMVEHECERYCNSEKHASNLTAALTKDSLEDKDIAAYWKWCCVRYHEAVDKTGRTLLHMAAAKGRAKLVKFLLTHEGIDIQRKDKESNFTPLHCSIFYGHIDSAVHLIKAGANIDALDSDNLTPLDHISMDSGTLSYREFDTCPHDLYVWGTNENFTLGVADGRKRGSPDIMDFFKRQRVHLNQVILGKNHSAFLARDGRLWMCGQGYGGRLGLEEESHVLTPKVVTVCANNPECVSVALGRDHTVVVMADKTVWTFGQNAYHQLGHDPPPDKITRPKFVRGLRHVGIIGASASTYHSAFWTDTRLYTCGLNGGQLGHVREAGATVIIPKVVSGLRQCSIKTVYCTVGATILANSYGEIYLFYGYICRKITSRPFYPKLLCAVGGRLDHKLDPDTLQPNGGRQLEVLVVTSCSSVYIWKESDRKYMKYEMGLDYRVLNIVDVTFHGVFCVFVTRDGKAYFGKIIGARAIGADITSELSKNYIRLTRIPLIHRAVAVASDPRGRNYAIVQYQPKCRLQAFPRTTNSEADTHLRNLYRVLERASYLQDVEFEVRGARIPAHRYIVGNGSKVLENMMNEAVQPDGTCVVRIDNVTPRVFRALLCFMYTKDFNLVTPYPTGSSRACEEMKLPFEFNGQKYMPIREPPMTGKEKAIFLKSLEKAAKKYAVRGLADDCTSTEGASKKTKTTNTPHVRFERERFPELWDTTLVTEDGTQIRAHKCILIARLEYFNSMMNNQSWRESIKDEVIDLPLPGEVLTILITYLYTGAAPAIVKSDDLDLVFITLIISDQLFCEGLKNICECTLGNLMNLDNAAEIFQIGLFYNAENLKQYALEFIIQNLGYMLEKGVLDGLHDFVLSTLSSFYRSRVPQMCMRHITAFCNAPDEEFIEYIGKTEPVIIEVEKNKPDDSSSTSSDYVGIVGGFQGSASDNEEGDGPNGKDEQSGVETETKEQETKTDEEAKSLPENPKSDSDPDPAKEEKSDKAEEGPEEAGAVAQAPSNSEGSPPESRPTGEGEDGASGPAASSSNAVAGEKHPEAPQNKEEKPVDEPRSQSGEAARRGPRLLSPKHLSESDFPEETDSSEGVPANEERASRKKEESQKEEAAPADAEQAAAPKRVAPKSLADIQTEEKAMKELRAFYNADTVKDERVSVRRLECRRRRPRTRPSAKS